MKKKVNNLSGNTWKYFLFSLSQRRHFIPILSIFFLTLPNTNAKQIGLYLSAGFLASFLFEIPSGYFSDKFGHKKTLILSKILMILSMTSFVFANSLIYFVSGAVFLSLSQAFSSGTDKAFMHDTLIQLKREKDYTKVMGKIAANVSLLSVFLTILLPFTTSISIITPLKINLVFDVLGFFAVIFLVSPKREENITKELPKSFFKIIKGASNPGFYVLSIFVGAIGGFIFASSGFRQVYLQSLGYPIILIGFIMGLSRLVWFFVGHNVHKIEKMISIKNLLKIEIFLFPLAYILVALFSNPYIVGLMFILFIGYYHGRRQIVESYYLRHLIKNKGYKATMLSVKKQFALAIQTITAFLIGYVMVYSFKLGYLVLGIILFFILFLSYIFVSKRIKK